MKIPLNVLHGIMIGSVTLATAGTASYLFLDYYEKNDGFVQPHSISTAPNQCLSPGNCNNNSANNPHVNSTPVDNTTTVGSPARPFRSSPMFGAGEGCPGCGMG